MQIKEREMLVLKRRKEGVKLIDIAKELGVSCTRVKQIEKDAKNKLGLNDPQTVNFVNFVSELMEQNKQDIDFCAVLRKLKYELEMLYKLKDYLMYNMKGNLFAQAVLINELDGIELWLKKN